VILSLVVFPCSSAHDARDASMPLASLGAYVFAHDAHFHARPQSLSDSIAVDTDLNLLASILLSQFQRDGGFSGKYKRSEGQ